MRTGLYLSFRSRSGAASALIILLLVMLVIFGVLAMVSAAANLKLARKQADWNRAWYLADAGAEAVYAELDLLCRSSAAAGEDAALLAVKIEGWLNQNPAVRTSQVTVLEDQVRIEALSVGEVAAGQGIDMTVRWQPAAAGGTSGDKLVVEKWLQWQPPFEYGDQPGGVWEG